MCSALRINHYSLFVLASLLLVLVGCRDSDGRQEVEGTILLDGSPLPEGRISLRPLAKGPTSGGRIVDGKFQIERGKGPLPGSYSVSIQSYSETGRMISPESNPGMKVPEIKQTLPEQYNTKTELRMEVSGTGENEFDFQLESS